MLCLETWDVSTVITAVNMLISNQKCTNVVQINNFRGTLQLLIVRLNFVFYFQNVSLILERKKWSQTFVDFIDSRELLSPRQVTFIKKYSRDTVCLYEFYLLKIKRCHCQNYKRVLGSTAQWKVHILSCNTVDVRTHTVTHRWFSITLQLPAGWSCMFSGLLTIICNSRLMNWFERVW